MRIVLVLDGERREVEVDLTRNLVRVGGHEWPIQVVSTGENGTTVEVLGERVEVQGDPDASGAGSDGIAVNGERHTLVVESRAGPGAPRWPPATAGSGAGPPAPVDTGPGVAVVPPMPGKVLEVRVREGDRVTAGQVLLVVEAMKMRNEVTAPVAGAVSELRATPGANVTARQVLLRLLPA